MFGYNAERCVISPSALTVIDVLRDNGRTLINNETLDEVRLRYPDAQEMGLEDASRFLDDMAVSEPMEITREAYIEALEVLPPEDWERGQASESFLMCEYYRGCVTTVCVRLGKRYFSYHDRASLNHAQRVEKVERWLAAQKIDS